ncbi:hypothetical protein [Pantoea dispersa]|uniref:hypothetical protein n=1 Tax=Pantoea dispersa TaxID=59814 RepID=UPI001F52701F|nr:hypothetical protein [Pantoea dispersa]MCI1030411.1 hypothetical protein [Pantoea dispersa]
MRSYVFSVLVIVNLILSWATGHFHYEMLRAQKAEHVARKEQLKSQYVLKNTLTAVTLFQDIARITHEDRRSNFAESEKRIIRIRKEMHDDACAHHPVPAAVADQLRAHRDRIRAHSSGTNPTAIAGGL